MDRREKMRARSRRAKENRDKRFGGKAKYSVLDLDAMAKDFGWEEIPWYKVTAGGTKNEIDIIMFIVTQDWYSTLRAYDGTPTGLEPGDWDYKFEIPVHTRWGADGSPPIFCRNEGIGGKCPLCEDRQVEWDKGKGKSDKKILSSLTASWRCFYNVYDYNQNAFVPWEAAYKSFEEMLQEEIDIIEKDTGTELIPWDWGEGGRGIEFKGRVKNIGETEYNEPQVPTFFERDPYDEKEAEKMISFDKYLIIPSYDEVCRIYYGIDDSGGDEPQQKSVPEVRSRERGRSRSRTGNKEEATETRQRKRGEDSGEQRTRSRGSSTDETPPGECPFGHRFGYDCNEKDDCSDRCVDVDFDACIAYQDELKKAGEDVGKEEPKTQSRPRGRTRQTEEKETDTGSSSRRRRRRA